MSDYVCERCLRTRAIPGWDSRLDSLWTLRHGPGSFPWSWWFARLWCAVVGHRWWKLYEFRPHQERGKR